MIRGERVRVIEGEVEGDTCGEGEKDDKDEYGSGIVELSYESGG